MKKCVCLLCIAGLLCGCQAEVHISEQVPDKEETATSALMEHTEIKNDEKTTTGVYTDYFQLELPDFWQEYAVFETSEKKDGTCSISFYEKTNHKTQGSGHLFTIEIFHETDDYSFYPAYKFLCDFAADNQIYHAVAIYPTDMQALVEHERYARMQAQIPEILDAIIWKYPLKNK